MDNMFCPNCGSIIHPNQKRCGLCGQNIDRPSDMGLDKFMSSEQSPKRIIEKENPDAPYLPYEPRETQMEIIAAIRNAIDEGKHIVIE